MLLVVGTGRSGTTSAIAAVRAAGLEIGYPDDETHLEDADFKNLNKWRIAGKISPADYRHAITRLVAHRKTPPQALKDPRSCYFIRDLLEIFDTPPVIWAQRDLGDAARSCHNTYGWRVPFALATMTERWDLLAAALDGYPRLLCCPLGDYDAIKEFIDGNIDADQGDFAPRPHRPKQQANGVAVVS